jgi:hypothetical protein
MPLPATVRVKLSSEAAGAIAITPVVVQEIPLRELVEYVLAAAGKDEARVREILLRGSLVSGGTRFRWTGWEPDSESVRGLLATFPDSDPSLPFAAGRCIRAVLRGGRQAIEIPRDAGRRKPIFRRETFWDVLMDVAAASRPAYAGYSYRDRADRYVWELTRAEVGRVRAAGEIVNYSTLRDLIRTASFARADLYVTR